MAEPLFHSEITDQLNTNHPLAYTSVFCVKCNQLMHAGNNENMDAWLETNSGAYCIPDWFKTYDEMLLSPDTAAVLGLDND